VMNPYRKNAAVEVEDQSKRNSVARGRMRGKKRKKPKVVGQLWAKTKTWV